MAYALADGLNLMYSHHDCQQNVMADDLQLMARLHHNADGLGIFTLLMHPNKLP